MLYLNSIIEMGGSISREDTIHLPIEHGYIYTLIDIPSLARPTHDLKRRKEVRGRAVELHSILDVLCKHRCNRSKLKYPGKTKHL